MAVFAASTVETLVSSVLLPVLVAGLTAAITLVLTRASEAANRRRDRYAEAVETLVAWVEYPYRVRRRTDDDPETLRELASLGHDLQERLTCHQTWIGTESPHVAEVYRRILGQVSTAVGPAVSQAWTSPPVTTAAGMNLGPWGPASGCAEPLEQLQQRIEQRFGWRRVVAWWRRLRTH